MTTFYNCSCFYFRNIFLHKYGLHVEYFNKDDFKKAYSTILKKKGCITDEALESVCHEINAEVDRRKNIGQASLERKKIIAENYQRLHPEIFTLKEEFLHKEFLQLVKKCKTGSLSDSERKALEFNASSRLYSFPVFTREFCDKLVEELENFEESSLPKGRPNTMNKHGCLLDELGINENFLIPFRADYVSWITRCLFPDWGGDSLDSHRVFSVKYSLGEDLDLAYHYDNAEITLNVSLGKDFTKGDIYFGGMNTESKAERNDYIVYSNQVTYGLLHRGCQMHGALPIDSGTRHNLIIWMRSSAVRNSLCPMCNELPQLEEDKTNGYGQGFTRHEEEVETVNICTI